MTAATDDSTPSGAERPYEVELKYRMTDSAPGERLLAADELAGFVAIGAVTTAVHEDRYLDTADGALTAAGYAARLRSVGGQTLVTLKGLRRGAGKGAMHRREELEGPADPDAAPAEWPESDARALVLRIAGGAPLGDLVALRQVRRQREYRRDGTLVELSLDDVHVTAADRQLERFAELEVELREGDEGLLGPLAKLLSEIEELVPSEMSKLERALEAVRRAEQPPTPVIEAPAARPRPTIPKSPGVLADDHLAEAGRKVLRFHLARMIAREPGTRAGTDHEELHGMRVATRRQRAAWRVFGEAFDPARTRKHRRRLREVATALGAVRDLDVLIAAGEEYRDRQPKPEAKAFDRLLASWRDRRETARVTLLRELDSDRYARWLDDYLAFTETEGRGALSVGPTQPHHVRDTMPSRIWAAYQLVRAYEPVLRWADVATLHELRIAAKGLRYTLEFVREALGPDAGPLIEKTVALQDHLGWLHDADVAAGLARAFLVDRAGDLSELESQAIGRYLVDRERELARLRRTVAAPWRGVSSLAFRRAVGRVVAGL